MSPVTQLVYDGTKWQNQAAQAGATATEVVIGRTTQGTLAETLWTGNKNGQRLLVPADGFLTKGSAWVDGRHSSTGVAKLRMSVYAGSASAPTVPLGISTNTAAIAAGSPAQAVPFTLPSIAVKAGTYIWVMLQGHESTVARMLKDGAGVSAWGPNKPTLPTDPYGVANITKNLYSIAVTVSNEAIVIPGPSPLMPVGDQPGWRQIYREDFLTPAAIGQVGAVYGKAMRGYDGFGDTSKNGLYTPDVVLSVSNSVLNYHLHTKTINGVTRARVAAPTLNNYRGQVYGKFSVRFRSDMLPGYKIAFLLWPSSNVWNEGEIDWPEGSLSQQMSPASAQRGTYAAGNMTFDPPMRSYSSTDSSGWHIATTEWKPGSVRWFWDNELVTETTVPSGVPITPMRWTLQAETEVRGAAPASSVSGHLQVDWAVAYEYVG